MFINVITWYNYSKDAIYAPFIHNNQPPKTGNYHLALRPIQLELVVDMACCYLETAGWIPGAVTITIQLTIVSESFHLHA